MPSHLAPCWGGKCLCQRITQHICPSVYNIVYGTRIRPIPKRAAIRVIDILHLTKKQYTRYSVFQCSGLLLLFLTLEASAMASSKSSSTCIFSNSIASAEFSSRSSPTSPPLSSAPACARLHANANNQSGFWNDEELQYLKRPHLLTQIADKANAIREI